MINANVRFGALVEWEKTFARAADLTFSHSLGQKQTLPIRDVFAETANTKGATRATPFAVCFGAPVG